MTDDERKLIRKKTKYANEDNYLALAETCQRLGELYKDREEHQRALNEYKLAAKAYEKLNRSMDRGLAFRMIGEMHLMMGQFKEALLNVQAYMRAARKEVNTVEMQRANVTLGRVYLHRAESYLMEKKSAEAEADLIEAEKAFHMGLSICNQLQGNVRKADIIEMQAGIYLNLGVTLDRRGKTEIAQEHMERAIRLAREADLFELLHTCYNTMALSSSKWEQIKKGEHCGKTLRLLNHALEVASRLANRATKMCQTLLVKADFFLEMGDFQSARQTLKRAYHLKTPVNEDAKLISEKLKVLVSLCRTEDNLITTEATNYTRRKELYERMGDGACKLHNYSKALDYYRRMLECAEALGEAGRQLLPCYVSLYQTYTDNKEYDRALEYLWKEHEIIADEPKEAYHTLLQIAKLYERQKKSFFDIDDIYRRARAEAKKLQSTELERVPVQRAVRLLRANCMDMMADNLEKEATAIGIDLSVVEPDSEELPDTDELLEVAGSGDDGEEHNTPNVGEEINLDIDLSDNSDVEGEANLGGGIGSGKRLNTSFSDKTSDLSTSMQSRTRKRGMTFAVRRNNKGETQLHQAAIAGNKVLVERLLEQGHPVNVRDHAGWLPLHEAAIHGHAEIVATLLDHGAHLNDKGGTSCDGITPLYDACCNGQLDVIEVLLDRGANATQKTDFGDTTLNVLETWYAKCRKKLSLTEDSHYERVRERLAAKFEAAAVPITPPTADRAAATKALSSGEKTKPRRRISSSDSVSPPGTGVSSTGASSGYGTISPREKSQRYTSTGSSPYESVSNCRMVAYRRNMSPGHEYDQSDPEDGPQNKSAHEGGENGWRNDTSRGVSEYREAMKALRKNKSTDKRTQPSLSLSGQKKRQAHLAMDEVDADDWLIDDMQQQSAKRSCVTRNLKRTSLGGLERKASSCSLNGLPASTSRSKEDVLLEPSYDPKVRYSSLIDSDDDDPFKDGDDEIVCGHNDDRQTEDDSAFNVLMKNSTRSFRRIQRRRRSSESRAHLSRRHSSSAQSSLLDAGFQRVASPCFEEKENLTPPAIVSTPPVKVSAVPAVAPSPYRPSSTLAVPTPTRRGLQVELDDGKSFTLSFDDQNEFSARTIGWLQNEITKRYILNYGKRPIVKIRPPEESFMLCAFSTTDPLSVLLSNGLSGGTTVYGQVRGYEKINFDEFYDDYCQERNLTVDKELRKRLVKMDRSHLINLEPDFALKAPSVRLPPADTMSLVFLLVFFQQDWLNHLDLSVNGITDAYMENLVPYLAACRNLRVLRLRLNLLTSRSVEMLCYGVKDSIVGNRTRPDGSTTPQGGGLRGSLLEELDLSHNLLTDVSVPPLAVLCNALPNLRILRLRSTEITNFSTANDHPSLDISRLETFDISDNGLVEQSVQLLLQQMKGSCIREANFRSLTAQCVDFKAKLWQTITNDRLDGLRVLILANCRLTDEETECKLLPAIARNCEKLINLDLSLNIALTKRSFLALLRQCHSAAYRLEQVRFTHDLRLWAELDVQTDPEPVIEYSPSAYYPQQIHATLPTYGGYTPERRESVLAAVGKIWSTLWPSRRSTVTRHDDGLNVTLSVE